MRDYKKYEVWQLSHQLTLDVYKTILPCFPKSELFTLASQTKRAAYSIPLNIAEGCGRNTEKDFVHFLDMALGSVNELEYAILLAKDLEYIDSKVFTQVNETTNHLKAKLIKLIKSIR